MKRSPKGLTALLLALVLSLTGLAALAESAPTAPYVQTSVALDINKVAVADILTQASMEESGEQIPLFDAQTLETLDVILDSINKVGLRFISGPGLHTVTLETEEDVLFDLQLVDDAESPLSTITTSLLPDIAIRAPRDVLKTFIDVTPTEDALVTQPKVGQAYTEAIEAYFTNQVPSLENAVPGTYEIEDAGTFTRRTSFEVDNKMLLGLSTALLDVFKQDEEAQEVVAFLLSSVSDLEREVVAQLEGEIPADNTDPFQMPGDVQELITSIETAIKEAGEGENKQIGTQTIYETEDGLRTYVETQINGESATEPRVLIAVLNEDGQNGQDHLNRVTIITDYPDGETHQAASDWTKLKHAISDGSNLQDSMIVFSSQTALAEAQQAQVHSSQISLQDHNGTYALVSGSVTYLESGNEEGSTSLFLLSNQPLISVYYNKQVLGDGDVPALHSLEGRTEIFFDDGVDAAEEQQLGTVMETQGVPELMVNIAQSLPEEAERIIAMLMAMEGSAD